LGTIKSVPIVQLLLGLAGYTPPKIDRAIVLHGHCHHKAIMKMTNEEALLAKTGATVHTRRPAKHSLVRRLQLPRADRAQLVDTRCSWRTCSN
jgi:hypothetical protein